MKIAVCYPPFTKNEMVAQLSQNRQFRYMHSLETRIYPLVMASAATILKNQGHEVFWLDGINKREKLNIFMLKLMNINPDYIVMETKTPLMKKIWDFIKEYKGTGLKGKFILVGDHVSAFPEESIKNGADHVICGGDYDSSLENFFTAEIYPKILNVNMLLTFLDDVPFIDRSLTEWWNYGEAYLLNPCAYILSGRGCGGTGKRHGECTFCSWQHNFWDCTARLRSPKNVVKEISELHKKYNIKEVFDDNESGGMWDKKWLKSFYEELKKAELLKKVSISSNARADSLDKETCELLKKCGYRLLKIGLESGNDKTLKKLNKLETVEQIKQGIKNAKDAGLIVMLTTMVGYPWETEKDVQKTYDVAKELMLYKTHFGDSLQSSIVVPYPGTPLWAEALKMGWFEISNPRQYEAYDMDQDILKSPIDTKYWCKKLWSIHLNKKFMLKSLLMLSPRNARLAMRGVRSLLGHLKDY